MTEKPHQECPFVDCGSSDAFSWNTDGFGYCHSCHNNYPSKKEVFDWASEKYPLKNKEESKIKREVTGITYEGIRGIDADVCKLYGIQLQTDPDGEPVQYAFRYPKNTKYLDVVRPDGKKKIWLKNKGVKNLDLFGPEFNAGSSNKIYITEGEFDAASLYQVLGKSMPVVSLPSSSIGDDFIKATFDYLSKFKEIVYAGELDDPGRKSAERLYKAYPEKFYYVPLTKWKDANEFLEKGDADDLMWAARKPQRYSPDNFFCSDHDLEKAIREENPYEYVPTGHHGLDSKIRGLTKGGITFIKAQRGIGKTTLLRYFEVGLLQNSDCKIAALHAEEMKSTTYRSMASYALNKNVNTKEDASINGVSEEEVIEAAKSIAQNDRTIIFEMRSTDGPEAVLDYIKLAVGVYGAEYVFIDHIQRLAYMSPNGVEGATSVLTSLAAHSAQLAKEFNVGIIFLSQVNDDGRTKYASALEEEAIICMRLTRNVDSEDEKERNLTHIDVDKNRPWSKLGDAGTLIYDEETTLVKEYEVEFDV